MAIVMNLTWAGVTPAQYDAVRDEVKWEDGVDGGVFHVAWFEAGALRVVDVWDSAEQFDAFAGSRLMPGVAVVGIAGEPVVDIQPAHRVFDSATGDIRA